SPTGSSSVAIRSSLSQHGITWTFSQAHLSGRFVNGDWWVIGPVTIVNITPPSQVVNGRTINGSRLNPTSTQILNCQHGYDSALFGDISNDTATRPRYKEQLNVARSLPRVVPVGSSLISTISLP